MGRRIDGQARGNWQQRGMLAAAAAMTEEASSEVHKMTHSVQAAAADSNQMVAAARGIVSDIVTVYNELIAPALAWLNAPPGGVLAQGEALPATDASGGEFAASTGECGAESNQS